MTLSLPSPTEEVRSWGGAVRGSHVVLPLTFQDEAPAVVERARAAGLSVLPIGLSRSYGASALNIGHAVLDLHRCDRLINFDAATGILRAEAGLSLDAVLRHIVPHGWFLPTTPGTRFVTLGGAVANDVHGKNHHRAGTFGSSVRRLGLWRSDWGVLEIAPDRDPELFAATIGGLGLTGLICWVELQLAPIRSAFLDVETEAFPNLGGFFDLASQAAEQAEHTVAWFDCGSEGSALGRGIFTKANWRDDGRLELHRFRPAFTLPVDAPNQTLNRFSVKAFNSLYYRQQRSKPSRRVEHYSSTFYPLDGLANWNRLYGSRGFFQYQCVVPFSTAREAFTDMLKAIVASGQGSFLAVLKTFGARSSPGMLSFPREGATLALDFSARGDQTYRLLSRLDDVVAAAGGRLYPAKDARLPPWMFRAGYPMWTEFARWVDPAFSSTFWRSVSFG